MKGKSRDEGREHGLARALNAGRGNIDVKEAVRGMCRAIEAFTSEFELTSEEREYMTYRIGYTRDFVRSGRKVDDRNRATVPSAADVRVTIGGKRFTGRVTPASPF